MQNCFKLLLFMTYFVSVQNAAVAEDTAQAKYASSSMGTGLTSVVDWSTEFPFLDLMKSSREWYDWNRRSAEGINIDEHGWVTSFQKGLKPSTVFLTYPEGIPIIYRRLIVRWQGKGKLSYGWCAKKIGQVHGGDRIKVNTGSCLLTIESSDKDNPIRNITIVPEKYIDQFDAGEIFNPDFLARVKHFRALRFMDWMKTNESKQEHWQERPRIEDRTWAAEGVPVEVMVQLANEVTADPWFNIPHLANAGYIKGFAEKVKAQLKPELKAYVEHSNEVWNWVFPQSHYALEEGKKILGDNPEAFVQWHGMRTAQICDIWKQDVFQSDAERVLCVMGTGWPGIQQPALECALWVAQGNKPCYQHGIDIMAVAAYFGGCLDGENNKSYEAKILEWSGSKKKGLAKAYEQLIDGRHFECGSTVESLGELYKRYAKEASQYGLALAAYEGGQHITSNLAVTQNQEAFYNFHIELNRNPGIKPLYEQNFANWKEAGGTLFMHFLDVSSYSKHGSWGSVEYVTQPDTPKWEALMDFNRAPCWWEGCR